MLVDQVYGPRHDADRGLLQLLRLGLWFLIPLTYGSLVSAQESVGGRPTATREANAPPIEYFVPLGLTTPEHLRFEHISQSGPYCGPNSLYILLKLLNTSVSYEELVHGINVGAMGCSLADLQNAAQAYGVPCEVRKVSAKELGLLMPPYVLHLSTPAESSLQSTGARDHFVVVTRRESSGGLVGIDPSSGNSMAWTPAYLSRNFSGYVMAPRDPPGASPLRGRLIAIVFFILLTLFNLKLARKSPK
jgi:hypothetical protein